MTKRFFSLALTCILAGCGGSGGTTQCDSAYWDGVIGTCLPEGWHSMDREELRDSGVPGEVVVAFQSDVAVGGQIITVAVTREALANPMESAAYSEASVASVRTLPGYEEIDTRAVTLDGDDVSLHIFNAQPQPEKPALQFFQVSLSKDRMGYTFTGAAPLSAPANIEAQIELLLTHATLEPPSEEE